MTVVVKIWGEKKFKQNHDASSCLGKVRDQIELALDKTELSHQVTVESDTPEMPRPDDLYHEDNVDAWDNWLYNHNAYAEDSSILVMDDWGGKTFSSTASPTTTTDGCCVLAGGPNMSSSYPVESHGENEHYHDMYNVLHELSHSLDAPTGSEPIGRYYLNELDNKYWRSPMHTMFDETNNCDQYNPSDYGVDVWRLTYTECGKSYLQDEELY